MNGVYFPNSEFPKDNEEMKDISVRNENYIEDVLKNNIGKKVKIYCTFTDSDAKTFEGIIANIGSDYIVLNDQVNNKWITALLIYINYVEFEEEPNI